MFCIHCGKQNPDGANFCASCGSPISVGRSNTSVASPPVPPRALPLSVKLFGWVYLGLAVAAAGLIDGVGRVSDGDTSLPALQNFSTGLGGALVVVYGIVILSRRLVALGRWWFLAAWCMNILAPIGLFFLALIIWSTLLLRKRHAPLFVVPTTS